jgi:hypothetical protein
MPAVRLSPANDAHIPLPNAPGDVVIQGDNGFLSRADIRDIINEALVPVNEKLDRLLRVSYKVPLPLS